MLNQSIRATKNLGDFNLIPEHDPANNAILGDLLAAGVTPDLFRVSSMEITIGRWGNAFALDNWFRQNHTGITLLGDEVFRLEVPDILDLKETCQKVLLVPGLASTLLPGPGDDGELGYIESVERMVTSMTTASLIMGDWNITYYAVDDNF